MGAHSWPSLLPPAVLTPPLRPLVTARPARPRLGTIPDHPTPPPPLACSAVTCTAPRGPRPRASPRARASRSAANASLVPAISAQIMSTCKRARVWAEGMCGGAVVCGSMRKAGVPRRRRKVARNAPSLSLPATPTAAHARLLPEHVGMSACAQVAGMLGKVVRVCRIRAGQALGS